MICHHLLLTSIFPSTVRISIEYLYFSLKQNPSDSPENETREAKGTNLLPTTGLIHCLLKMLQAGIGSVFLGSPVHLWRTDVSRVTQDNECLSIALILAVDISPYHPQHSLVSQSVQCGMMHSRADPVWTCVDQTSLNSLCG